MEIKHGKTTALKQPAGHGSGGAVTTRILPTILVSSSSSCYAHPNHKRIGRESLQPSQVYHRNNWREWTSRDTELERVNKYD